MPIIIKYVHIVQCECNMTNINVVTTIFIHIYVLFHYFGKKYFNLFLVIFHTLLRQGYIATWAPEGGNNFITTRGVARPKTCSNIAYIFNLRNIF